MRRFEYVVAGSLDEAAALSGQKGVLAKAGGIDLLDRMKEGHDRPSRVLQVQPVLDSAVREAGPQGLWIGAGATLAALGRSLLLQRRAPSLAHTAGEAATPQVREMATVGGNLLQRSRCWYFRSRHYTCLKDGGGLCFAQEGRHENHALFGNGRCAAVHPSNLAPALVSLHAIAELHSEEGVSQLPVERLFVAADADPTREHVLEPGQILTGLWLPAAQLGPRAAHYEVRQKQSYDWPLAMAAVNLNGPAPRLVLGAVAATALVVRGADALLAEAAERPHSPGLLDALAARAVEGATPLPGNAWRLPVLTAAVRRAVQAAAGVPEEEWR